MCERLIGFDLREMWVSPETQWPADFRALYCLRTDLEDVLSTDPQVWPSAFDLDEALRTQRQACDHRQVLWTDLASLIACIRSAWGSAWRPARLIALTVVSDSDDPFEDTLSPVTGPPNPGSLGSDWECLGYDVSESLLLSGLSSCGYSADSVDTWREEWSHRLNSHHLFDDPAWARRFSTLTHARVPEHGPFFVWGLWWNPEMSRGSFVKA